MPEGRGELLGDELVEVLHEYNESKRIGYSSKGSKTLTTPSSRPGPKPGRIVLPYTKNADPGTPSIPVLRHNACSEARSGAYPGGYLLPTIRSFSLVILAACAMASIACGSSGGGSEKPGAAPSAPRGVEATLGNGQVLISWTNVSPR